MSPCPVFIRSSRSREGGKKSNSESKRNWTIFIKLLRIPLQDALNQWFPVSGSGPRISQDKSEGPQNDYA